MSKPRLYLPCNYKGGAPKSSTLALPALWHYARGDEPLLMKCDTNPTICKLLHRPDVTQINLTDEDRVTDSLGYLYEAAVASKRPAFLDLPAKPADVLSFEHFLANGVIDAFDVVGVVPIQPNSEIIAGALAFLDSFSPERLIMFELQPKTGARLDDFSEVSAIRKRATAVIHVPFLTTGQTELWRNCHTRLDRLETSLNSLPPSEFVRHLPLANFWRTVEQQLSNIPWLPTKASTAAPGGNVAEGPLASSDHDQQVRPSRARKDN